MLPDRVSCGEVWTTVSSHGRTGRAGSDLGVPGVMGDLGVLGGQCEPREVCEFSERCVLSESREHGRFGDHGGQRCQHNHGKPRVGDGKVEQGVEGAQEHEDTLL